MLKVVLYISSVLIGTAFYTSSLPNDVQRKSQKQIEKLFGANAVLSQYCLDSTTDTHYPLCITLNDTTVGYAIITKALGCRIGGCDKPQNEEVAFEHFYFMTAFDDNKQIIKVKVLSYSSDHGYQIASKSWLRQFENQKEFEVGRNIDAISGATISVNAITKNINEQQRLLSNQ